MTARFSEFARREPPIIQFTRHSTAPTVDRQVVLGRYVYRDPDWACRLEQWAARQAQEPGNDVAAAKALFFSLLNEIQRRLYAGLESLRQGHGGKPLAGSIRKTWRR